MSCEQEKINKLLSAANSYVLEKMQMQAEIQPLRQQLADTQRKLEAAEKDAERYRWLRDKSEYGDDFYLSVPFESPRDTFKPHEVDEAIDRAIEQSKADNANAR